MKTTYKILVLCGVLSITTACSLNDYKPTGFFSELTEESDEKPEKGEEKITFKDEAAVQGQLTSMYKIFRGRQEHWVLDKLLVAEAHSDNAYAGTTGAEVVPFETNKIDGSNSVLNRDWNRFLSDLGATNKLIVGVENTPDGVFKTHKKDYYTSQAKVMRSLILFDMVRLWGNIPLITTVAGTITSETVAEVYPQYFPEQNSSEEVYKQIEKDLLEVLASPNAPKNDPADKTILSKSVARALLAKVYAEKPLRDYAKVIQYVDELAADGFALNEEFGDLFAMNAAGTDIKARNTKESILETQFPIGAGNWISWMFGRNLINWDESFTWAKWVTPSRDLIRAFDAAGDEVRKEQSIVYYECNWSNYYPASHYPFMYKIRSGASSVITLRYADLLLLKAEALIMTGDLSGAANILNKVRARVGLKALSAADTGSKDALLKAYLNERRLELAFEGQRWYDLVRLDKVEEVMNAVYAKDEGRLEQVNKYDQNSYLLPIPQSAIDANPNLKQNPGY